MAITTLLTTEDFEATFKIDFNVDSTVSEESEDNHQLSLNVNEDNSLTGTVEEPDLTGEEASPIVLTDIDSEQLLIDDPDHLKLAINLNDGNDNLTGASENQVILTIIDGNDLTDRQFIDPLTGATVDFTDSDFVVTIDSEALNDTEANNLVLEEDSFTLNLNGEGEVIGVSIDDWLVSSDSAISLEYSLVGSTSFPSTEMSLTLHDGDGVTINELMVDSTI